MCQRSCIPEWCWAGECCCCLSHQLQKSWPGANGTHGNWTCKNMYTRHALRGVEHTQYSKILFTTSKPVSNFTWRTVWILVGLRDLDVWMQHQSVWGKVLQVKYRPSSVLFVGDHRLRLHNWTPAVSHNTEQVSSLLSSWLVVFFPQLPRVKIFFYLLLSICLLHFIVLLMFALMRMSTCRRKREKNHVLHLSDSSKAVQSHHFLCKKNIHVQNEMLFQLKLINTAGMLLILLRIY